jgi:hypothetical protein
LTSGGVNVCASVKIVKYGQVQCLTKENTPISDGALSLKVGDKPYNCISNVVSACNYQTSATLLTVTSLVLDLSTSTITITGTGFSGFATSLPHF